MNEFPVQSRHTLRHDFEIFVKLRLKYQLKLVKSNFYQTIPVFIAENGPECVQEKHEDLQSCFNSTFGSSMNVGENNLTSIKTDKLPAIAFEVCITYCNKINLLSLSHCSDNHRKTPQTLKHALQWMLTTITSKY